jgi:hypothetical protein
MCGVHGRRQGGGAHPVLPPVSRPPRFPSPFSAFLSESCVARACLSYAFSAQVACMTVSTACASSLVHPPVVEAVWERVVDECLRCRLMLTHALTSACAAASC